MVSGNIYAECGRDRVGCMAGYESVILALRRVGERTQTAELTVGMEPVATAGEYLMRVCLVAHIPY